MKKQTEGILKQIENDAKRVTADLLRFTPCINCRDPRLSIIVSLDVDKMLGFFL